MSENFEKNYDPAYGDDKPCMCGHRYDFHIVEEDTHEPTVAGCVACACSKFVRYFTPLEKAVLADFVIETEAHIAVLDLDAPHVVVLTDPDGEWQARGPFSGYLEATVAAEAWLKSMCADLQEDLSTTKMATKVVVWFPEENG